MGSTTLCITTFNITILSIVSISTITLCTTINKTLSIVHSIVMRLPFMLSVSHKPLMLSVIMLNVVMLSVVAPTFVPSLQKLCKFLKAFASLIFHFSFSHFFLMTFADFFEATVKFAQKCICKLERFIHTMEQRVLGIVVDHRGRH